MDKTKINMHISVDLLNQARSLANKKGENVSYIIREALRDYIEKNRQA